MVEEIEPTAEEFEAWDESMLEEAVKEAAEAFKVKWMVKGMGFYAQLPSGKVYRLPLGISAATFEELANVDDSQAVEVFRSLFRAFAPKRVEDLENEPIQSVMGMMERYGEAVALVQGASLGE